MRILHALPHLSGGGAERQLAYLAREQARGGHEVHVAFLEEGPAAGVDLGGATRHRLRASGNHDPRIAWQLWRLAREHRPDVLHTWILQMDVLGGMAALLSRTAWVCREPVSGAAYGEAWKQRLRNALVARADAIVANSEAGSVHWARLHPESHRAVIHNALPLDAIAAAPKRSAESLGVAEGRAFALYAGRLENEQKNVDHLLEALHLAVSERDLDGVLCGDGPHRDEALRFVAKRGLAERVHLAGFVPDVWSYMKSAAVFVSVSYLEGRPNAVMEAMACGCPLVVSDIPMHREFLDEETALLVDPDDSRAIARAIGACLDRPEAARARAEKALERARGWSVPEMARQYERVYRECLARRGRS